MYKNKAFKKGLILLIKSIGYVFLKKRTIYKRKDGFVLSVAYISYYIMLLIYIWFNDKKIKNL